VHSFLFKMIRSKPAHAAFLGYNPRWSKLNLGKQIDSNSPARSRTNNLSWDAERRWVKDAFKDQLNRTSPYGIVVQGSSSPLVSKTVTPKKVVNWRFDANRSFCERITIGQCHGPQRQLCVR
jgi:hypothetical protein